MQQPEVNIFSYIVDDDPDVHEIVESLLLEHGIASYRFFTSGGEMLQHLSADIYVCLIDHYLEGGITGLDILKAIKKVSIDSFVIVMSGQNNFDIVVEYINECADRYVDKNKPDYLQKMITYLTVGIQEAKKRYEELNIISNRLKERNEKLKEFDL